MLVCNHIRQLDRVSRELLAQAWRAGAGPGDAPFTIDLDSTICETYGLAKEGARHHGYTGKRGYHPLLAIAAGTGDVLMSRLREGRGQHRRGAAHFLRETVGRVATPEPGGDSRDSRHGLRLPQDGRRFSITIRSAKSISSRPYRRWIWTPIPYWMDRRRRRPPALPSRVSLAAPVRLIVRRVKPTPGSQLALFATYSYHGFNRPGRGDSNWRPVENAIRDLYGVGLNHLPSGRFAANGAWLAVQVMAHNIARWTARIGLDRS